MLKKILKRVLIGLGVIVLLYGIGRLSIVTYDSYVFVDRQPYMVMQTNNSITLKWQTPKVEIGKVAYGDSPTNLNNVLIEENAVDKHLLKISKLKECTKYYYSVSSNSLDIDNKNRSFSTLCQSSQLVRIWAIGDSGKRGDKQLKVYQQMLNYIHGDLSQLNMWLLLGDNAYKSGTQKQYNKNLFEPYIELVKNFTPWAVIGNHDSRRFAFYNIFDFPTQAESGGVKSGSQKFYAIDNGPLHLVMLDSETESLDVDGEMAKWLRKDLKSNQKPWVIVAFHTPPYTDGGHKSDDDSNSGGRMYDVRHNFVPIFDEFGVDLVLSGHSHGYERSKLLVNHLGKSDTLSAKNILQDRKTDYNKSLSIKKNSGTIYLISGSASKLDRASYKHPAMPFSFEKMGSLLIEITPTTLRSKFLNIDGIIADEFIIKKEKK